MGNSPTPIIAQIAAHTNPRLYHAAIINPAPMWHSTRTVAYPMILSGKCKRSLVDDWAQLA